mgnify:CR=1 FL=1
MKKTIILLLLLLTNICFSQKLSKEERQLKLEEKKDGSLSQNQEVKLYDFILEDDNKVTWQKIYDYNANKDSLVKILQFYLKNNLFTRLLEKSDDGFIGQSAKVKLSIAKDKPMASPFSAFIKIDVKDNKYRVYVTDIIFEGAEVGVISGGISISSATSNSFGYYVVNNKKNDFKKSRTAMNLLNSLNDDLTSYFTIKIDTSADDW